MEHPPRDTLLRFLLCTASRSENRQVVTHLLARCPACAATLRKLRREPPLGPPPDPNAYDLAFDRAAASLPADARSSAAFEKGPDPRMGDVNDPLDHLDPDELIEAASQELRKALAILARMRQALNRKGVALPPAPSIRCASPSPGGRGGDGRGGQGVRGPYPRRVK